MLVYEQLLKQNIETRQIPTMIRQGNRIYNLTIDKKVTCKYSITRTEFKDS
jgi:hypothetical protein